MKKLITIILLLAITSSVFAQREMNKIVFDENANQKILLGYCDIDSLKTSSVTHWFFPEYNSYSLDEKTLESIKLELIPELEISIILGTWCGDSKREVPRFIKITEFINLKSDQFEIICVDRNKEAEKIPIVRMNIEFVPTFIFYYEGEEVGRIIESPKETLEKNILNILLSI